MQLETKRLVLREVREDDFPAIHEYASDPETVKYMPFGPNTEQDTREFIRRTMAAQKEQPRHKYQIGLTMKADGQFIGGCGLAIGNNPVNKDASIGWILNRRYWNQGFMTEAAGELLSFGFRDLGLHRVIATCDPLNTASYRVMEKIGMQREGYLREATFEKGRWRDSLLYAILEKRNYRRVGQVGQVRQAMSFEF